MAPQLKLHAAWSQRLMLLADGYRLCVEGDLLRDESGNISLDGARLMFKGDELMAGAERLWAYAIIAEYGCTTVSWERNTKYGTCTLGNGDIYSDQSEISARENSGDVLLKKIFD